MKKYKLAVLILFLIIISLTIISLVIMFLPPVTPYASFINTCELTRGNIVVPTLICPWYNQNCKEDMSICECGLKYFVYKDIKNTIWIGCPTV